MQILFIVRCSSSLYLYLIYRTHLLCPVHHYILSHPAYCTLRFWGSDTIAPCLTVLHPVYRTPSIVLSPLSIELYLELAPGNQHFLNIHANLTMLQLDINAFLKTVWAATKGERSVSTRSKWRANWGYNPTTIDNASRKRKMDGWTVQ